MVVAFTVRNDADRAAQEGRDRDTGGKPDGSAQHNAVDGIGRRPAHTPANATSHKCDPAVRVSAWNTAYAATLTRKNVGEVPRRSKPTVRRRTAIATAAATAATNAPTGRYAKLSGRGTNAVGDHGALTPPQDRTITRTSAKMTTPPSASVGTSNGDRTIATAITSARAQIDAT
jgi:hypothetical protein